MSNCDTCTAQQIFGRLVFFFFFKHFYLQSLFSCCFFSKSYFFHSELYKFHEYSAVIYNFQGGSDSFSSPRPGRHHIRLLPSLQEDFALPCLWHLQDSWSEWPVEPCTLRMGLVLRSVLVVILVALLLHFVPSLKVNSNYCFQFYGACTKWQYLYI